MTFFRRSGAAAALALVGVGLLAGCGGGSTASSTPTLSTDSAAASNVPASGSDAAPAPLEQTPPSVGPMPGAEAPQPTGPVGGAPQIGPRETAYLTALKAAGITPSDPGAEIGVAQMICWTIQQKQPMDTVTVFVNAVAGSDAKSAGKPATEDSVAQLGQIYINTAKATYCQ